jgi:hypothetical protein
MQHRSQFRHLCSELVSIIYSPGVSKPEKSISANLEEIGETSALVLSDAPLQRGFKVWINCEMHHLRGRVKSCTLHRQLGYFVEIALDPESSWSPAFFTPKHLLQVFRRIAA